MANSAQATAPTTPHQKLSRPVLESVKVTKTFNVGREPYTALRNVTATINKGEFVIIYGPSGSGKSTFLNMLIGLEQPTSGVVKIDGTEIQNLNDDQRAQIRAAKIGVVTQQAIWVKSLTVRENVAMPALIRNATDTDAFRRADVALYRVGLSSHMLHKPTELSGGQQQRVNFARALVNDPAMIILDEPTGNLDSKSAAHVIALLQNFNVKDHRTIVMITHNLEYLDIADRTIMIKDGQIEKETHNPSKRHVKDEEVKTV